jgi:hypothetical protein
MPYGLLLDGQTASLNCRLPLSIELGPPFSANVGFKQPFSECHPEKFIHARKHLLCHHSSAAVVWMVSYDFESNHSTFSAQHQAFFCARGQFFPSTGHLPLTSLLCLPFNRYFITFYSKYKQ